MGNYWLKNKLVHKWDFDEWFKELCGIAEKHGATLLMREPWEDYFKDGYSPANAFSSKMNI